MSTCKGHFGVELTIAVTRKYTYHGTSKWVVLWIYPGLQQLGGMQTTPVAMAPRYTYVARCMW